MWFYKRGKCGSYLVLAIALIFGRQTVIFFGRETFLSVKVGWHGENLKSLSTLELHFTATTGIKHGVLGWNPTSVTMVTTAMCEKMCERIWECVRESYSSILLTYEWVHKHNFSGKIARPFELTNLATLMEREDRITFTFHGEEIREPIQPSYVIGHFKKPKNKTLRKVRIIFLKKLNCLF